MPSNVKTTAILAAREGKGEELRKLLEGLARPSRDEPGNLRWDLWQDQSQRDRYVIDELYLDASAVAAHRETPHYKDYLSQVPNLADRIAVTCDPVQVRSLGG